MDGGYVSFGRGRIGTYLVESEDHISRRMCVSRMSFCIYYPRWGE